MTAPRRTVLDYFHAAGERFGDKPVLFQGKVQVTFSEMLRDAARAAEGLRRLGVKPGDRVGFYADNSRRWIVADLAIQCAGAVSVPRGTDTPPDEMIQLFAHAEVGVVFCHSAKHAALLEARRGDAPSITALVVVDPKDATGPTLDSLIEDGAEGPDFKACAAAVNPEDLATIIYTSGTTGRPKGVMLTQSNFGHQIATCPGTLRMHDRERFLSILPPWHIFERTVEYVALCCGCELVYTDRRRFKEDLGKWKPTFVPSVPRIWQSVYDAVMKKVQGGSPVRRTIFKSAVAVGSYRARRRARAQGSVLRVRRPAGLGKVTDALGRGWAWVGVGASWLPHKLAGALVFGKLATVTGGRLRGAISGGGLMPAHVDRFFQAIGVPILVGYGLTETSPVISLRREERNVLGTIGTCVPEVEVQVRDLESGAVLRAGERGVIHTRGPHIMKGYFRDEALTATVIDADGWFDTGDLGFLTEEGDVCFGGRAKETIVLGGGENVEPAAVEEALLASPLIEQALVVGQDRKTIAALVWPSVDALASELGVDAADGVVDGESVLAAADAAEVLRRACIEATRGLKPFERVSRIRLLPEPMTPENGLLTQTLKPRRHVIVDVHAALIDEAYA